MAAPATRYTSLFPVGRGGMGSVSVALEQGDLGFRRIVAQKRLLPEVGRDARHKAMFLREAKLAALLCHPNVVRAFDAGEHAGELYLTMEYVAGQTLAMALERLGSRGERLPIAIALHVVAEVCEGLHAAHELRDVDGTELAVVHRDVSPHNVMLGYDGSVKLLDFGVAKIEAEASATRTGEVKGKVAYMSPEQAMGDPVDRRSDLYAVGAILFECVTGARMWGSGTDMEVMRKLALGSPPRLADTFDGTPGLFEAISALHGTLVASNPDARPASAGDVAATIRAAMLGAELPASKESVAALVRRLFAEEEADAKTALSSALERAASDTKAVAGAAPSVVAVEAAPVQRSLVPPAVAIAVGVFVLLAGGAFVFRGPADPKSPPASSGRAAAGSGPPSALPSTAAPEAPSATAAVAVASASAAPVVTPRSSRTLPSLSPKGAPPVPAAATSSPPPVPPPTVDEHPF